MSEVKAISVTGTGAVVSTRARILGVSFTSDGVGAGTLVVTDGTGGATVLDVDCSSGADRDITFPGGLLCKDAVTVATFTNLTSATFILG